MALSKTYQVEILPALQKEFSITNRHAVPHIQKIVVNTGIGTYLAGEKDTSHIVEAIKLITGQAPVINRSRVSISNFKLRKGMPVGISVTLRRERMYTFLERMITYVLPRVRDFQGVPRNAFDGHGNYSFGIKEHTVFPEIPQDDVVKPFGLQVTIVTSTENDEQARKLLTAFTFPFTRSETEKMEHKT